MLIIRFRPHFKIELYLLIPIVFLTGRKLSITKMSSPSKSFWLLSLLFLPSPAYIIQYYVKNISKKPPAGYLEMFGNLKNISITRLGDFVFKKNKAGHLKHLGGWYGNIWSYVSKYPVGRFNMWLSTYKLIANYYFNRQVGCWYWITTMLSSQTSDRMFECIADLKNIGLDQ